METWRANLRTPTGKGRGMAWEVGLEGQQASRLEAAVGAALHGADRLTQRSAWEAGTDVHTLICVQQVTTENLLPGAGNSPRCSAVT